jgi:ADP-ribosylation factor 2-binding protein
MSNCVDLALPQKTNAVECIQVDEGGEENFLDIVDNFDGMSDDEDEDVSFVSMGGENEEDDEFDMIVGALEEIMMDDEFQELQRTFATEHCSHFEDTDENKLIYTEIFAKYTELVEGYLERRLRQNIATFSMPDFMDMLMTREEVRWFVG